MTMVGTVKELYHWHAQLEMRRSRCLGPAPSLEICKHKYYDCKVNLGKAGT